ncbi:MAG: shikimate dehydrogenase [Deltaproteobacteria bacterium]|nr:shikimate dehydrogenase [Deltaproteobacteria bacterium]
MKVFCILSDERAGQSKSPIMFSRVLKRQGINGTYVPFVVKPQDLGQAIQSIRILHMAGANITVPYKEAVIPLLDVLSEGANIIGAVNTIVRDGDRLKGYNTNAIGVMDALTEAGFEVDGKSALVFGTGGAARAVVFILNWLRAATIFVAGRQMEKARSLINTLGGEPLDLSSFSERPLPVDIVVNATAVSSSDESPEMADLVSQLEIPGCELVFDLNYGRPRNFWEELARAKGIRFMDGLSALAYQARRAFALWTGLQVPPEEFLNALHENGGEGQDPI